MRFSVGRSIPAIRATELLLALTLLVPRIAAADHADHTFATHDFAVLADFLYGRTNLHRRSPGIRNCGDAPRMSRLRGASSPPPDADRTARGTSAACVSA